MNSRENPPLLPSSLVVGFAASVAMWCGWYVLHLPGFAAGSKASALMLGLVLLMVTAFGGAQAHKPGHREGWVVGLIAGLISAAINLLLLGSKVVEQPATTADLEGLNNQLRPDAPVIVLGFFAFSAVVGALGGFVGSALARTRPRHESWLATFSIVAAVSFLPLLVVGGIVTSTDSGMAVPDSVTTYGSLSFLFPLSLMAEPRIYFEHTHRLFGTLVGLTTLVLAVWVIGRSRAWGWLGLCIAMIGGLLLAFAARHADTLDQTPAILVMGSIVAIAFVLMIWGIVRAKSAQMAGLLVVLVVGQGLFGALRVSEISTPLAMAHGVLAQLVFGAAAALATLLNIQDRPVQALPPEQTRRSIRSASRLGPWVVAALILQLILGAGYRHTASHAFLGGHVLFAVFVAALAIVIGSQLSTSERYSDVGQRSWRCGKALIHLVSLQVVLGVVAVALVAVAGAQRPIPLAHELEHAAPLPMMEAFFATAHQATGAALLALAVTIAVASHLRSRQH
ncbi:MAG: hypothetical protein KF757_01120 [Phycisphaeraceae bacterium]|nr:hypothetical protein [Phycisphaeraceae bacterium]MCW5761809.1 hypothetical protein [Phycisphaeraceae bacterium]